MTGVIQPDEMAKHEARKGGPMAKAAEKKGQCAHPPPTPPPPAVRISTTGVLRKF